MYAHLALQGTLFAYRTLFRFRYADPFLGILLGRAIAHPDSLSQVHCQFLRKGRESMNNQW